MSSLFDQYDILEKSGLFDAVYYSASNPDVASSNTDPILHYLEHGARAGLNPSSEFDTAFYLEQCKKLGDLPEIPLLHFVIHGARRGLKPSRDAFQSSSAAGDPEPFSPLDQITLDLMTIVPAAGGRMGLKTAGWLIASEPVAELTVEFQDEVLGYATYGINRPDVAAQHPTLPNADQSGFVFLIDALPATFRGTAE